MEKRRAVGFDQYQRSPYLAATNQKKKKNIFSWRDAHSSYKSNFIHSNTHRKSAVSVAFLFDCSQSHTNIIRGQLIYMYISNPWMCEYCAVRSHSPTSNGKLCLRDRESLIFYFASRVQNRRQAQDKHCSSSSLQQRQQQKSPQQLQPKRKWNKNKKWH